MSRKRTVSRARPVVATTAAPTPPMPSTMAQPRPPDLPSVRRLVQGSLVALAVAIIVLVVVVLPAEYGVDPTGIGQKLGLRSLSSTKPGSDVDVSAPLGADPFATASPVWRRALPFRSDEMQLVLQPNEGGEIKAVMKGGERYVFAWEAVGGRVDFDMHGEQANGPPDAFTSYWKGREQHSAGGAFTAPFDGTHGWYWKNRGDKPVTIRVRTSGYYEKLYRPAVMPAQAK
jgi:hypothetical protein